MESKPTTTVMINSMLIGSNRTLHHITEHQYYSENNVEGTVVVAEFFINSDFQDDLKSALHRNTGALS